jgi:hypothetical protein
MRIIDAWMQHPSAQFLADPMFDSLRRWAHGQQLAAVDVPVEATIAAMDAAHVNVGMLCAWWGPHGPLITNDEVAAIVGRSPDRFAGVTAVDLARQCTPSGNCAAACVTSASGHCAWCRGCGICLPTTAATIRCTPNASSSASRSVSRLGTPGRCVRPSPAVPSPTWTPWHWNSPELVIVGGHIGYPWTAEMISLTTKYPNVYIDTSAYKASRYPRDLVEYQRDHGRRKVLFGSNHPAWPAADCLSGLASLQLDDETTELFLHGNAERVFNLATMPGSGTS